MKGKGYKTRRGKFLLMTVGCVTSLAFVLDANVLANEVVGSYATHNYGNISSSVPTSSIKLERTNLNYSLGAPDVVKLNVEGNFTGIGYFDGVTYSFDH